MKKHKLLVLITALLSSVTLACPFHMSMEYDDNSPVLPGTMQLALAGMYAEQTGIIHPVTTLEGLPAYQRASWWLTLFSRTLEKQGIEGVYILLTDVPIWSSYGLSDKGKLEVDITPPEDHANTIMFTHVSLQAIIEGNISMQEAFKNNLILIHQDKKNIIDSLLAG
ncbi:hypothetical protein [Photobacterium sp. DNB22_13_2]